MGGPRAGCWKTIRPWITWLASWHGMGELSRFHCTGDAVGMRVEERFVVLWRGFFCFFVREVSGSWGRRGGREGASHTGCDVRSRGEGGCDAQKSRTHTCQLPACSGHPQQ